VDRIVDEGARFGAVTHQPLLFHDSPDGLDGVEGQFAVGAHMHMHVAHTAGPQLPESFQDFSSRSLGLMSGIQSSPEIDTIA